MLKRGIWDTQSRIVLFNIPLLKIHHIRFKTHPSLSIRVCFLVLCGLSSSSRCNNESVHENLISLMLLIKTLSVLKDIINSVNWMENSWIDNQLVVELFKFQLNASEFNVGKSTLVEHK